MLNVEGWHFKLARLEDVDVQSPESQGNTRFCSSLLVDPGAVGQGGLQRVFAIAQRHSLVRSA